MHDNYIVSYSVNLIEKELIVHTVKSLDDINKRGENIYFSEVLTHSFKCILPFQCNIIFDIEECEIDKFISYNQMELKEMIGHAWPIVYKSFEELKEYLILNGYKYIRLNSSLGMWGWVLAKSYYIKDEEYCLQKNRCWR